MKINQSAAVRQATQLTNMGPGVDKIDAALVAYSKTHKRLPCPASPTSAAGTESIGASNATCATPTGVVPWGTLGISLDDALDSWGRRISYRVFFGATGFTQDNGLDASNCNTSSSLGTGAGTVAGACATYHETKYTATSDFFTGKGLTVNDLSNTVNGVAYVLISHGASGYGAYGNDTSGTRLTLPNTASKEYINTQVPSDNTYWIQTPSDANVSADSASHFDDIVRYKKASDLLDLLGLAGRNWGTVSGDLTLSQSTVTAGAAVTMTITISSTIPTQSKLATDFVYTLPANVLVTNPPAASTTCGSGILTAVANASSFTLAAGALVPANGSCTIAVNITPMQPATPNSSSITTNYSIAQYALMLTPNLTATTPITTDAAAVRNMTASTTRSLTATAPPPKVTSSAGSNGSISPVWNQQGVTLNSQQTFTVTPNAGYVATVGGTCGGTLSGNTYTTNAIISDCTVVATFTQTFTVTPSAGSGGGISPSTAQAVPVNTTATFTVSPNSGYTATVGGTCGGSLSGTTYTTSTITANCTVIASFYKITADSTFTASDFASALGSSVSANTTTGQKTIAFPGFSATSMSSTYQYLGYISNSGFLGLGLANAASGGSVSEITNGVTGAGIRLTLPIAYRYFGITLYRFGTTSSGTVIERASAKFYDANNSVIATQILKACRNGTGSQAANFSLNPGASYQTVEITPLARTGTGAASSFFIGEVAFCLTNSSCKTNYSTTNGSTSDCAYP